MLTKAVLSLPPEVLELLQQVGRGEEGVEAAGESRGGVAEHDRVLHLDRRETAVLLAASGLDELGVRTEWSSGLRIRELRPGLALWSGLSEGDVLLEIQGRRVANGERLMTLVRRLHGRGTRQFGLRLREADGREVEVTYALSKR